MTGVFVALAAIALIAMLASHVALLLLLAMRPPRTRALVALAVPPLVPYWGWQLGLRWLTWVWGAALFLYALTVAVLVR
jgi:hypothetical protein